MYDPRLPSQSLCSSRHPQYLPSTFLELSHLATPQRPADVHEVCRDDDGRTRPPRRRMGQHHPSRRSPHRRSAKNLTLHATHEEHGFCHRTPARRTTQHGEEIQLLWPRRETQCCRSRCGLAGPLTKEPSRRCEQPSHRVQRAVPLRV